MKLLPFVLENRMGFRLLASLVFFAAALVRPASAQDGIVNNPAEHFAVAPGGVDMRSGRYVYNETDLSIGDKAGGLTLTRSMPEAIPDHYNPFGNFASNWDVFLTVYPFDTQQIGSNSGYRATLHNNGLSTTFDSAGSLYGQKSDGPGGKLTYAGGTFLGTSTVYTYTGDDGTVIVFRPIGGGDCSVAGGASFGCASASSITRPDGTTYTLSYAATGNSTGNYARLSKVESSRGYALVLEGSAGMGGPGSLITKACLYNLTLGAAPGNCTSGALASATYSYSGMRLTGVTGPDGATASFGYGVPSGYSYTMQFYKPGQSTPWLTNTLGTNSFNEEGVAIDYVQSQSFADGHSYTYTFNNAPTSSFSAPWSTIVGGSYTDNQGNTTSVVYGFPYVPGKGPGDVIPCPRPCQNPPEPGEQRYFYQQTPGPESITDALGHTTNFTYCDPSVAAGLPSYYHNRCSVGPVQSFTDAEGIRTEFTYIGRYVTQSKQIAKPGTGLASIIRSATYDCTQPKLCGKPMSITDARGNTTNYTYKLENGEILTESQPADANGVRPVKRYEYVQRYAWISNGAGSYVQGASPSWLLSATRTCRTTATVSNACAGGTADEVVTAYDYGPDSGPNNLLLRGQTVTADGTTLRTCYGYDALGNKISETSPRAGLAVCP